MALGPNFQAFKNTLYTIPQRLAQIFVRFIDGIGVAVGTVSGVIWLVIGLAFAADLLFKGNLGLIQFVLTQGKDAITVIFDTIKGKVIEMILLVVMIAVLKKKF